MVRTSDEFDRWWATCDSALQYTIAAYVGLLEAVGPQLGRPYADTLEAIPRAEAIYARHLAELENDHGG